MSAGNYQVRERLIDMVGAVSGRLGRLLELSPDLEDRDRLLVNRLASDIAALQSSVLEAIYSNRVTSPASLRELHDLEIGALVTLDRLESHISATLRRRAAAFSYAQYAAPSAAPTWGAPSFGFAPDARPYVAPAQAWPGSDARYIDVPYEPVATPQSDVPTPLSPTPLIPLPQDLAGTEFEAYGDALRRAVSSFKTPDASSYAPHHPQMYERPQGFQPPAPPRRPPAASRAVVPVPVARADAEVIEAAPASLIERSRSLAQSWGRGLVTRQGLAGACLAGFGLMVWSFMAGDGAPKRPPVVIAKVNQRMEPLSSSGSSSGTGVRVSPPAERAPPNVPDPMPREEEALPSRIAPLSGGRSRDLFVPVIATMATRDGLEQKIDDLKSRYPTLVEADAKTGIEPVIGADGRQWYRAFLLPGRSQSAIRDFCRDIREAGYLQCWAKRLSRPSS